MKNRNKIALKLLFTVLLFANMSCKPNTEKTEPEHSIFTLNKEKSNTGKIEPKDSIFTLNKEEATIINGDKYIFYRVYYHESETNHPEIREDVVIDKFKNMPLVIGKDSIMLDHDTMNYTVKEMNARKFFMRQYLYEFYTDVYKNVFDIDVAKNVRYLQVNSGDLLRIALSNNSNSSPFINYFINAGSAVFINDCLFLEYKRYFVCFKKEDKTKVWDKKYCELPFDYPRLDRLCDWIERYPEICKNEYPRFYFKDNKELETLIFNNMDIDILTDDNNIKILTYYYNIKTNLKDINTVVVVFNHPRHNDGDIGEETYIMNIKDNKIISYIKNEKEEDDIQFGYFVITKDLKVIFYDGIGYRPKEKIFRTYKINEEGMFVKVK